MSIETEFQSTIQNVQNAYNGLNNLGATIPQNKTIENIKSCLDEIYDKLPKTEFQEGTDVTIENGLKGKIDFDDGKVGFGQASQESTNGTNLANTTGYIAPTTSNGVTYSLKDNVISLNGTASASFYINLPGKFALTSGDYTFAPADISGTYTGVCGKYPCVNGTDIFDGNQLSTLANRALNSDYTDVYIRLFVSNGSSYSNYKCKLNLVKGTYTSQTIPTWEEYSGGYASPSPNWEQEVKCVAGRNKLDVSTNTNGYVLSPTGELNQFEGYCVSDFIPVQPGATYNVSYKLLSSVQDANTTRVGFYDSSKTFISRPDSTDNPYIITIPSNCHYVRLSYQYSARSEMQFEEGSAIHSYLPYGVIQETIRSKNIFDFAKLKNGNPGMNYPDRASITFGEDSFRIDVTTVGDNFTNSGMTVTNQTIQSAQRKFLYEVKPNTKYTFIFVTEHSEPAGLSSYYCLANKDYNVTSYDNTYANYITIDSTHRRFYRTFTTKNDTKYVGFRYGDQSSVSVTYSKIMLVEGEYTSSNLPDYEPYVTPRTYQFSLGNNKFYNIGTYRDYILRTTGKNKYNLGTGTYSKGGFTGTYDGSKMKVNGTTTGSTNIFEPNAKSIGVFKAGSYVLSSFYTGSVNLNGHAHLMYLRSSNDLASNDNILTQFSPSVVNSSKAFTLSQDTELFMQWYANSSGIAYDNLEVMIQIEEGSTATDYQPYGVGNWYKVGNFGEKTLNGTENWTYYTASANLHIIYLDFANLTYNTSNYNFLMENFVAEEGKCYFTNVGRLHFYLENMGYYSLFPDKTSWTTFLSNNNQHLVYQLSSPTYTPITGDLATQLEAFWNGQSNNGTTIITSNGDLPMIIKVRALKGEN